jgi:hypothetical protein
MGNADSRPKAAEVRITIKDQRLAGARQGSLHALDHSGSFLHSESEGSPWVRGFVSIRRAAAVSSNLDVNAFAAKETCISRPGAGAEHRK